jgi:predicted nucleotidyltransferase
MNIEQLREKKLIIFEGIVGSKAYGTSLPNSDIDIKGVFVQPLEDILGFGYIEQVNDEKNDTVYYEIKRFLELLRTNNPNILELLNLPEDCILHKDPIFNLITDNYKLFLTKKCRDTFASYALQQIKKAKGQDKKQNWEKDKVTRKDILDFVYVIEGEKSIPWKEWNLSNGDKTFDEKFIGVVNVPNARDTYALFYDINAHSCFSELVSEESRKTFKKVREEMGLPMGLGYKGLVKISDVLNNDSVQIQMNTEEIKKYISSGIIDSNQLRLSSIPKGEKPICNIIYNKDGYTQHCKDYKSYQTWLEERNEQRWVDVQTHGQKIDGKNMMHCRRLMDMAREIAEGKGIVVRRPNAQELIDIRQGKVDLQSLIDHVEAEIKAVDELYKNSNLPNSVDVKFVEDLLIDIRKKIYKL